MRLPVGGQLALELGDALRIAARRQLPLELGDATTRRRDVLVCFPNASGGGADAAVERTEALYLYPLQLIVVLR